MQEPEATQRNWLDGSQVVVAMSGQDTNKDNQMCVVLYVETAFEKRCG